MTDVALVHYSSASGELQAFPYSGFLWPVWYNTRILDEAGLEIPTTTDELIAAAQALREADKTPSAASTGRATSSSGG